MKKLRTFGEYMTESHFPGHRSELEDEESVRHYRDIDEQEEEYVSEQEEEGNDVSEDDAVANFMKKI